MDTQLRLLILEDNPDDADLLLIALKQAGIEPEWNRVQSADDMRALLANEDWDLIISDFVMPNFNALDALAVLKESGKDIPFIVVSGTVGEETAVKTMRAGAHDYLMKGSLTRLGPVVQREISDAAERRKQRQVERDLKEKEEQLLQSQKIEAIGSLAAGIAHDFNNMLGVIMLLCDAASEELDNLKSTIYYFNQIGKAAEHASLLTRQLLTFSRRSPVDPSVINLNDQVTEIEKMLRRTVGENINFDIKLSPSVPNIFFDRSHVGQLIMNLVVNARDAMPKGGKLQIETRMEINKVPRTVEGATMPEGKYTVLSVRDNGHGMDERVRSRIFEPFFTTKETGKGTGLGLPTVYGIVKQNESYIVVFSAPGKGSVFEIFIPAVERARVSLEVPETPVELTGNETILVVEDQPTFRATISSALKKRGYRVIEAENGREALSLVDSQADPVHLVLTDVIMPELSGTELVDAIRKKWRATKVIYMSGHLDEEVLKQGLDPKGSGASFLEKPFSSLALLQKVRSSLNLA